MRCLWIDLDVLYGFATYNLIRKRFLMVVGGKISVIENHVILESPAFVALVDLVIHETTSFSHLAMKNFYHKTIPMTF